MNASELRGYLTGLILGDASLSSGIKKRAMVIESTNQEFINQIQSDLSSCTNFKITVTESKADDPRVKKYWKLRITSHPYFAKKYHHFYDDKRHKIASREALSWLSTKGLANWYMADGYIVHLGKKSGKITGRLVEINTDKYDEQTVRRMCEMLSERFGILATADNHGNGSYRIRIRMESYERFFKLIKNYVCESMKWKLYLGYEKQPIWMSDKFWNYQEELGSAIAQQSLGEDIV